MAKKQKSAVSPQGDDYNDLKSEKYSLETLSEKYPVVKNFLNELHLQLKFPRNDNSMNCPLTGIVKWIQNNTKQRSQIDAKELAEDICAKDGFALLIRKFSENINPKIVMQIWIHHVLKYQEENYQVIQLSKPTKRQKVDYVGDTCFPHFMYRRLESLPEVVPILKFQESLPDRCCYDQIQHDWRENNEDLIKIVSESNS